MANGCEQVVDKGSAVVGLPYPQEKVVPVPEANHSTICKFKSRTQNYGLVISEIRDLVDFGVKTRPHRPLFRRLAGFS